MKWTVHKPKDCDLGKKPDQQGNKNKGNQWQVMASNGKSGNIGWDAGQVGPTFYQQMMMHPRTASPHFPSHGQAHHCCTYASHLFTYLSLVASMHFLLGHAPLHHQASSQNWIHCKCCYLCNSPMKTSTKVQRKRGWGISLQKKGKCPSRFTFFCNPPSGLVVMSKILSATLTWMLNEPFFTVT